MEAIGWFGTREKIVNVHFFGKFDELIKIVGCFALFFTIGIE